jgi:hypothetical protein
MHEKIRQYLGELVMAFAALEDSLCEGLAQILDLEYEDSKILFSAISFNKKIQILNALLKKYIGKDGESTVNGSTVYKLLSKANELEAQRNKFIHSDWEFFFRPGENHLILKRSKIKYKRNDITKVHIEDIGEKELLRLINIIDDLKECANELFSEFGQVGSDIDCLRISRIKG